MSHATLASEIKDACSKVPAAGRFGDNKVWVHAAWAIGQFEMSLEEFKLALLDLNARGHLSLSRCDLVEACDPYDVRRSAIEHMGARFNFIRI